MDSPAKISASLTKAIGALVALLFWGFLGYWAIDMNRVSHDKAVNADALQRLWSFGTQIPLGVVIPANNQWTTRAFVAERFDGDPPRQTSILILDDHYRGDDPTYRSDSGVIGNELSIGLLCSIPTQASIKRVNLDPIVLGMIRSRCRNVR